MAKEHLTNSSSFVSVEKLTRGALRGQELCLYFDNHAVRILLDEACRAISGLQTSLTRAHNRIAALEETAEGLDSRNAELAAITDLYAEDDRGGLRGGWGKVESPEERARQRALLQNEWAKVRRTKKEEPSDD